MLHLKQTGKADDKYVDDDDNADLDDCVGGEGSGLKLFLALDLMMRRSMMMTFQARLRPTTVM